MATFLVYILKSTICLALFYLGYKVLLSNETFFRFNRKVLIGGTIICLLLPILRFETTEPGIIQQPFIELERMISWEEQMIREINILSGPNRETVTSPEFPYTLLFKGIYLFGGIFALAVLLRSFICLCLLIRRGQWIHTNNYVIVLLPEAIPPFNWWKYIVLSESDYRLYPKEILTHELAHYHKRHCWDLLFMEAVILFHWFNPASWLLKRELQEIHEYQADTAVLQSGIDATKYQLLLVKKAVGASSYTFANSFNQSKLKKRITMMFKEQSNKWARWKIALFLPLAASVLYAFASHDVNRQLTQFLPGEDTTIQVDTKKYTPEFFESEMNKFLREKGVDPALSPKEMYEKLEKQIHFSPLLVNSLGKILFEYEFVEIENLQTEVTNVLLSENNKQPVVIVLQHDRGTPAPVVERIYQILSDVYVDNKEALADKKQPIAVINVDPVNYGVDNVEKGAIVVTLTSNDDKLGTIQIGENASEKDIRKLVDKTLRQYKDEMITVHIQASAETPMGRIADVKGILSETNALLKAEYSTQ